MADDRKTTESLGAIAICVAIGAVIAWAGSDAGASYGSVPVFALCAALAFAINWIVFVPSALAKTEHYYDLTGGLTYLSVIAAAVLLSGDLDLRAMVIAGMVAIWALRLSIFLFIRVSKAGRDSRFDEWKQRPVQFLMAWTIQGLWVLLTAAAALAAITGGTREPLGAIGIAGIVIWAIGMVIEIVADRQKSAFKADPANQGQFIHTGLWAWSRHPNYFGEIVLWTGMAIVAAPVLTGWQWATMISPVFVAFLLIKVSGIPLLEAKADERWGGQADYEAYKTRTPVLVLRPPRRNDS